MVFNERVMDYTVSTLYNDVVDYRRVLRLTTVSGQRLFLAIGGRGSARPGRCQRPRARRRPAAAMTGRRAVIVPP
jgi:hypothetical protein